MLRRNNDGTSTIKPVMEFLCWQVADKSVIFVAERPSPSIEHPHIIARAATQALPTFSSSASDTSSSLGGYLRSILFYPK